MKKPLALLIFIFFFFSAVSFAGGIDAGPAKFYPYFSFTGKHTDNVFASPADEKSDYITVYAPGLSLELPFRRHMLFLDYNAVVERYDEFKSEETTDLNGLAKLDLRLGGRIRLDLSDTYRKGHEPRGQSATGRVDVFKTNTALVSASYALAEKSKIQLDYSAAKWDFAGAVNAFRERDADRVSLYLFYRFLPKTSAFIEYDNNRVDFNKDVSEVALNLDNTERSGYLGLTWEISENSTGTAKAGYTKKDYADEGWFDTNGDSVVDVNVKDHSTWTASVDLSHEFSSLSSLKVTARREINETNLSQRIRYFETTGASFEYERKLSRRFSMAVNGFMGNDSYSDQGAYLKKREDRTMGAGARLGYAMREWLRFSTAYNYRDRNSNIDVNDYRERIFTFFNVDIKI
ncbi:MAG: outer membrane beta-barrel protein [Deltaproteobacteria bacterium]|nr:outer membrane beta-barrel protein [Deltaproteobacteria bacterium]